MAKEGGKGYGTEEGSGKGEQLVLDVGVENCTACGGGAFS